MNEGTLSNAGGAVTTANLNGRTFQVGAITLEEMADLERWAQQDVYERAKRAAVGLPVELQVAILQAAVKESSNVSLNSAEGTQLMASVNGSTYLLWLAIKKVEKDVKLSDVRSALNFGNQDEVDKVLTFASGQTKPTAAKDTGRKNPTKGR